MKYMGHGNTISEVLNFFAGFSGVKSLQLKREQK